MATFHFVWEFNCWHPLFVGSFWSFYFFIMIIPIVRRERMQHTSYLVKRIREVDQFVSHYPHYTLLLKTTLQCGIFTWHNRVWNSERKGTTIWWWPTRMIASSTSIWWKTYSPHAEYTPGTPKPPHSANDESRWKPKANCRWIAAETEGVEWWWK